MIFAYTWQKVLDGSKTQTRRLVRNGEILDVLPSGNAVRSASGRLKWVEGRTYAVQPGRGKRQVARIRINYIYRQRLQEITEDDAKAEGFASRDEFAQAWNNIHREPCTRWEDNPLVWVITFELVR